MQKIKLVFFKQQRKKIDSEVKINLRRKRRYSTDSVKYISIRIDEKLNWKHHVTDIAIKLNCLFFLNCCHFSEFVLFKIRNSVNVSTLKTIYYAIFDSHINYANVIWVQNFNAVNRAFILQKKALRIIGFHHTDCHLSPLLKKHNLLKFEDKIQLPNVLLACKYFKNILPSIFDNWFTLDFYIHNYNTATSPTDKLFKPSFRTNLYGQKFITISAQLIPGIKSK